MRSQLLGVGDLGVKLIGSGGSGPFDSFNRADGAMGADWTAGADTAPVISGNKIVGTAALTRSVIRTKETYGNDHFSEITVSASALAAGDWVAPAVRMQASGNTCYLLLYFNDNVTFTGYALQVYKRVGGTFTEIDQTPNLASYQHTGYTPSGTTALNPGDRVRLSVVGSNLYVSINGTRVMKVTDSSIASGGAPGVITFGAATADAWAGANTVGPPSYGQVFTTSPPNSARNGGGHNIKVLVPTSPNLAFPHHFLYVLPVDPDGTTTYGDGLDTLWAYNAHNIYNLTIVQPQFGIGSWYLDTSNPGGFPAYMHETFMVSDLVPWVTANFATSGTEKHQLMGFSRSGWGGFNLLMRHPTVFAKGAFWDWPFADSGAALGPMGIDVNYGNAAYLDANYVQNSTFLDTWKTPFQATNRIWVAGHGAFGTEMAAIDAALTAKGILHTVGTDTRRDHAWWTGWVPEALAGLAALP